LLKEIDQIWNDINWKMVNEQAMASALVIRGRLEKLIKGIANVGNSNDLKEVIKALLNEKYAELIGFPVFIHWAFLYSPDLIKSKFNVSEKKFDCNGIPGGCTELTVLSGEDKGKSMRFDQYNRLIFIDAKKEGTAQFQYGFDFTVNLPKAYTMDDIMSGKVALPD